MPHTAPELELDAYLRLHRASLGEWLTAIREISGCDAMACRLERDGGTVGALAALGSRQGSVVCIHAGQGVEMTGCRTADPILVQPLAGEPEVALDSGLWRPLSQLTVVRPEDRFRIRLTAGSRVLILRPSASMGGSLRDLSTAQTMSVCEELIACYLHRSSFFRDHVQARQVTSALFDQLSRIGKRGSKPACDCPDLDRRLLRAMKKIRQEPDWDFNLAELASHAGVSERNLYYLMKRETGITPYRFYQRDRLVRVRRRLVDCQCEVPHISWYAADEGFSHLGRFASLYRQHFGELPSETVQWRRSLQAGETVRPAPALAVSGMAN
ncbi:MAG: helix-turn-helix domain-containing protein [Pseudomonadota bacterium]